MGVEDPITAALLQRTARLKSKVATIAAVAADMVLAATQTVTGAKTFVDGALLMQNVAGTFSSAFTNTNTASRTYTLPDSSGTVVLGGGTASGTNTGDNAPNSLYSGLVSNATHTGDATGATALTVTRINGVSLAGLATGVLKNTAGTGVPSIAANSDLPAMTATVGGAVPTPPNNTTTFLRGDGVFAAPSASVSINEVEIDVGALPVADASISVVDASINAASKILGGAAYKAASGKDLDECEMDALEMRFEPLAGTMNVHIKGLDGYIEGPFVIWYTIA